MRRAIYRIRNLRHRLRGWKQELMHLGRFGIRAELRATVLRADGRVEELGVIGRRIVTDAGVAYIVDGFDNTVEPENLNYHASGTDNTAEDAGDTTLGAEVESRQSGTQSQPSADVYQTVATISYTATRAIVEHGIFSASSAGTLLDRTVFSAINVNNGDSIQFTYQLTVSGS